MMSPLQPMLSIRFRLTAAAATAAIASTLAVGGAVQAQSDVKARSEAQIPPPVMQAGQGTPKRLLDQKDHGAVLQRGGPVGQYDRAPELALDAAQKQDLMRAVLAGDNAQKEIPDYKPARGADASQKLVLHPMPAELQQEIPALKYYHFANIADREIAVVDAMSRKVVDVIAIGPQDTAQARPADAFAQQAGAETPSKTGGSDPLTGSDNAEQAMNSKSGQNGKAEPGAQLPTSDRTEAWKPGDNATVPADGKPATGSDRAAARAQTGSIGAESTKASNAAQQNTAQQQETARQDDAATPSRAAQAGTPDNDEAAKDALRSESGRSGKAEPGAHDRAASQNDGPLYDHGVLNMPGAAAETQTKPAKFSEINDALDDRPTMAGGAGLSPEQAAEVYRTVMDDTSVPSVSLEAKPATALPNETPVHRWPETLVQRYQGLAGYGYVKTKDKVVIATLANKIAVGWISAEGQDPTANLGQRGTERR